MKKSFGFFQTWNGSSTKMMRDGMMERKGIALVRILLVASLLVAGMCGMLAAACTGPVQTSGCTPAGDTAGALSNCCLAFYDENGLPCGGNILFLQLGTDWTCCLDGGATAGSSYSDGAKCCNGATLSGSDYICNPFQCTPPGEIPQAWGFAQADASCCSGGHLIGGAPSHCCVDTGFSSTGSGCCQIATPSGGGYICSVPITPCGIQAGTSIASCSPQPAAPDCCVPGLACGTLSGGGSGCCYAEGTGPGVGSCSDSTCCDGLVCDVNGMCNVPCSHEGQSCESPNWCCAQAPALFCDNLNNNPPAPPTCAECYEEGQTCDGNNPCCGDLVCDSTSTCQAPPVTFICQSDQFSWVMELSAIGCLATAILIALMYMVGEFLQNARFITWAKTEAVQVFVSLAIVSVLLFILSMYCNIQIGEFENMFSVHPAIYANHGTDNLFSSADRFIENLQRASIENIATLRYNLGVYEIRTSFTKYECDASCLFSMTSLNIAWFSGDSLLLAVTNNLLSTATISYLAAAFQYFTLQYIYGGLFIMFLPLAIVVRSIPFMRQLGGALIAIFVGLYLLYPLMIAADAFIAPGMAKAVGTVTFYDRTNDGYLCNPGNSATLPFGVFALEGGPSYIACQDPGSDFTEEEIRGGGIIFTTVDHLEDLLPTQGTTPSIKLSDAVKVNVLIFLTSVFLPALNFVVIAVFVREISRFLGEEADISRLGQMV